MGRKNRNATKLRRAHKKRCNCKLCRTARERDAGTNKAA